MWQEDTFDPTRIDEELGWAQDLGMNTMRVYLHDLLHKNDAEGLECLPLIAQKVKPTNSYFINPN